MDLHSKLPSKDSREILTSSAWNALIHHPVVEEEDSEELPSTVDMDAIKEAPSTPMTAPTIVWPVGDHSTNVKGAASEDSSSEDDDESDGSTRSSSGSDSDESGSDSWSSSSSSRSSSCSSKSGPSGRSSPTRQTFSVSKADFDQGGLKLKISALKVSGGNKTGSELRSGTESDNCSSASQEKVKVVPEKARKSLKVNNVASEDTEKKSEVKVAPPERRFRERKAPPAVIGKRALIEKKTQQKLVNKKPSENVKPKSVKTSDAVAKQPTAHALMTGASKKSEVKVELQKSATSSPPKKKISEATKLRSVRRKPVVTPPVLQKTVTANSGPRYGRNLSSQASQSTSCSSDSSESEEGEGPQDAVAEITELAQQLGHIEAPEALPSMTEHLQVINQEDLAAILPDVVTTEANAGFDGFEDVSSESGKAEKKDSAVQDSGSDVELPDQIVSEAIKRIHVDSEDVDNSDSDKETGKQPSLKGAPRHKSDSESSEGRTEYSTMYSSSLLQQFVEKTEILSAQCERLMSGGRARKTLTTATVPTEMRTKRQKPVKPARAVEPAAPAARSMPELEAYRLDCAQSNVSPDSGIQSVPGSPVNEVVQRDSTPPVLRPVSPPEKCAKKRPGRPKKYRNGRVKNSQLRKSDEQAKVEDRPQVHNLIPGRRGPGRPKKAAPVLEPSVSLCRRDETDTENLNIMLNEICERVNRRLELPPTKGSRSIEIKELERIISDHKSNIARNSKIDAIFSKSKMSNLPNVAIVKPMQHHLLNERKDDDEKQNKRGGRRGKLEKFEDVLALKSEARDGLDLEKLGRERRKSEREKKALIKPAVPPVRSNCPTRSRSRNLSSGIEGSCDKAIDTDGKKREAVRTVKNEKQRKEGKKTTKPTAKVGGIGQATTKPSCAVNYVQPMPRKTTKKRPKYLSLRHNLLHHKHKRKKNKKHRRNDKDSLDRAWFLKELEKVISDLQKFSLDNKKNLPTAPVAPTQVAASVFTEMAFPTESRVKRIGKKRKGSEKPKGSDRESGAEKARQSDRESSTEDKEKEKEKDKVEKEKPKRKQKKMHLEMDNGKSEANPNEQRLPLKKRHYHISSPSQASGEGLPEEKEKSAGKEFGQARREPEKALGKDIPAPVRKDAPMQTRKDKEIDKSSGKDQAVAAGKKDSERTRSAESQRVLRSSVDDVMEANMTRFSFVSPMSPSCDHNLETGQRTVIVTPKKRHRVEEEEEEFNCKNQTKQGTMTASAKTSSGKTTPSSRPTGSPAMDKGGGKCGLGGPAREGVIKSVGNTEPKRRSGSRSSSLNNKDIKSEKVGVSKEKNKKSTKIEVFRTVKGIERRQTRSVTKPMETVDPSKTEPLHIDLPLLTIESIKVEGPNSDSLEMATLTPATDVKQEDKSCKQPPAGIFEPSEEAVAIDSSVLVPLNSPSEMGNNLKGSLSLQKIKKSQQFGGKKNDRLHKLDPKSELALKHKKGRAKMLQKIQNVRANLAKLSTQELLLQKAKANGLSRTVRRRKFRNRTGFPTSRRKKKKPISVNEVKTADAPVITPSASISDKSKEAKGDIQIEHQNNAKLGVVSSDMVGDNSNLSDKPLSELKVKDILQLETSETNETNETDEDVPLKQVLMRSKKIEKTHLSVEEKLNAGRMLKKRALKRAIASGADAKRPKVERALRTKTTLGEKPQDSRNSERSLEVADAVAAPVRKRKRSSTIKNTKSKMKSRYQLPLLSMKKFKRSREEEKSQSDAESEMTEIKKKPQPRWRKKYLTAGLFSDYYKTDHPQSTKQTEKSFSKIVYNPEEHEHGLMPPPAYCNKYIRLRREDFLLPYDLWWLHSNNQLPGRDIVPSWNYRKIRTNVYYDVKPQTTGTNEVQACNCKLPTNVKQKGCGEDCINRMVFSECSPQLCPCKDRCSNQRIQRHEYAPGLDRFMTKDKGWGVRTTMPIKAGEFILEYVGEVISDKEFKDRMQSRYVNDTHHYCLHLDGGLVIDGHRMGGDGRFVNHSCEPNCEMQKWTVNGLFRMALFALRNIPPNQELTYDYNFSLFNPVEGQVCLCGAKTCRGVIGGKSQRVTVQGGTPAARDKKTGRGRVRKNGHARRRNDKGKTQMETSVVKTNSKPMSHQQRCFAQIHHCFLLRNVEKVKRGRDVSKSEQKTQGTIGTPSSEVKPADVFYTQLNALSTLRSIKTRRLAQAEDNPELAKTAKLAHVFKELYSAIVTAKDEKEENLATPFTTLPSKKKHAQYYVRIQDPIDLNQIEQNINSGKYSTIEAFDLDIKRLFANNVRFYGRTSELGIAATRLKRVYNIAKLDVVPQLEEILGEALPATFLPEKTDPGAEEEDVIRCICGLYKDEGVMIQCERCLVWQHCDCVKADDSVEHYLCERCQPREVNYEILMSPQPEYAQEGQTHYVSLMRGTLQLRVSDTVYVLRDMLEESVTGTSPPRKVTYKTIKNVDFADLDIFRIERLWIDDKGAKFAFGHHYLRPHETYHEPTRKFFVNEVMRVPLYEVVPLDLIMQHCWVLDLSTYCKGRPVGAPEEHVYICEYRVDKSAHLFAKIAKPHPICTKNYAFEKFDTRLRPVRTYTPHGEVPARGRARSNTRSTNGEEGRRADSDEELPLARVRDHAHAAKREMQKKRLNKILLNLLSRLPKQPLDVTYLLEPVKRARSKSIVKKPLAKKQYSSNQPHLHHTF